MTANQVFVLPKICHTTTHTPSAIRAIATAALQANKVAEYKMCAIPKKIENIGILTNLSAKTMRITIRNPMNPNSNESATVEFGHSAG